jgi:hypothetical protein
MNQAYEEALEDEQFRATLKRVGMYWMVMNQQPRASSLAQKAAQAQ